MNHPQPFTAAEIEAMRNPCYCQRDRGDPKGCTRCRTLATFDAIAEELRTTGVVATNALDDLSKARSQIAALSVGPTVPIQCPDCGTEMRAAAVTRKAPAPALPDAELAELERLHADLIGMLDDVFNDAVEHEKPLRDAVAKLFLSEIDPLLARLAKAEAERDALAKRSGVIYVTDAHAASRSKT